MMKLILTLCLFAATKSARPEKMREEAAVVESQSRQRDTLGSDEKLQAVDSNSIVVAANSANASRQSGSTYPTACFGRAAGNFDLNTVREAFDTHKDKWAAMRYIKERYNKAKIWPKVIHLVYEGWFQNYNFGGQFKCVNYKKVNTLIFW